MKCRIWIEQYGGAEGTNCQWRDRALYVSCYIVDCQLM